MLVAKLLVIPLTSTVFSYLKDCLNVEVLIEASRYSAVISGNKYIRFSNYSLKGDTKDCN